MLSDPVGEKIGILVKAADAGFDVTLIYIGLESCGLSRERVEARVSAGGHDVPPNKLATHYERSLENLKRGVARLPRVAGLRQQFVRIAAPLRPSRNASPGS